MDMKRSKTFIESVEGEKMSKQAIDSLNKRIDELEKQINDLLKSKEDNFLINFPWAGNLGQWYWIYTTNKVMFNDKKVSTLGYDPKEIGEIGFEFFTSKLHPDDYDIVMNNMKEHLVGKRDAYEVEYRIMHKDGHYLWYYDRGIVTQRDESGKPLMLQGIVFDITETKKIEERLRYLSERDTLTGFYNRRLFFEHLDYFVQNEDEKTFSLIMYDIDYFKLVNDRFGHLVGDNVLRLLADLITKKIRKQDHAYRYGGEEFFIVLPKTKLDDAVQIARRLHKQIQDIIIPDVGHVTVSMGVVSSKPGESIDDVVKRVDDLLYDAKRAGRNVIKY